MFLPPVYQSRPATLEYCVLLSNHFCHTESLDVCCTIYCQFVLFLSFCFANMAMLVFEKFFCARIYRYSISLMSKKDVLVEIGAVLLP